MIINKPLFDRLVDEAWKHEFSGWDFGYIAGRMIESPLSWDYRQLVRKKIDACLRLNEMLQERVEFEYSCWTLDLAVHQLGEAGFQIVDRREDFPPTVFTDIGAVIYYLKVISWQIAGFTPEKYYDRLVAIHNIIQETGRFVVTGHRFYVEAVKS